MKNRRKFSGDFCFIAGFDIYKENIVYTMGGYYLRYFQTESAYTEDRNSNYGEPWVSYTMETLDVDYNKTEDEKMLETPLTFKIVSGGTLYWYANNSNMTKTIEYSKNGGDWTSVLSSTGGSGTTICEVSPGDVIEFRGNNAQYGAQNAYQCFVNTEDCEYYAYGNVMSLINYDNFKDNKTLTVSYALRGLFYNSNVMSHPIKKLFLPATALRDNCYYSFFENCTKLERMPELPATTLQNSCYKYMFAGCTSLKKATPVLPAMTLPFEAYYYMFSGCTSLSKSPELPATTLGSNCYRGMFSESGIFVTPHLPAASVDQYSYRSMFYRCNNLTKVVDFPATSFAQDSCSQMFYQCQNLVNIPPINVASTNSMSFNETFYQCTSLFEVKLTVSGASGNSTFQNMFWGCTGLRKISIECTAETLPGYCFNSAFKNCSNIVEAYINLQTRTPDNSTYSSMFEGCSKMKCSTKPVVAVETLKSQTCSNMFANCSSLLEAPDLNIVTISNTHGCFNMFSGCASMTGMSLTCTAPSILDDVFSNTYRNCRNLESAYIEIRSTSTGTRSCDSMFNGCSKMKCSTTPIINIQNFGNQGCQNMFYGCSSLEEAPALNILSLSGTRSLYCSFYGCSSLTGISITCTASAITNNCFENAFRDCVNIEEAYISLQSNVIAENGCLAMFRNCRKLKCNVKPVISATTFGYRSCQEMFHSCSLLEEAPDLYVTAFTGSDSFRDMFTGCIGITDASLICTTESASTNQFNEMFYGCKNLEAMHLDLQMTSVGQNTCFRMFRECEKLDFNTKPSLPATTLGNSCYDEMFLGCLLLTKAPDLPAATLAHQCYHSMFYRCLSLTQAPAISATTLAERCCWTMFTNCSSLITGPELVATGAVPANAYNEMFGGCSSLNYVKCLATDISASNCVNVWMRGVQTTSGTFVKNASMTSWPTGQNGIPANWTVVDA